VDKFKNFYFLEVNTRLQVEHPVTELVTGVDLVLEQFRIASGRPLRLKQSEVRLNGHAMECRIAAEDPFNNFAPSLGTIAAVSEPSGAGVRVDSSVYAGAKVSVYYDPMIAKLIVWAPSRAHAILRMRRALREYRIAGIQTNIPFHLRVMQSLDFQRGRLDTKFVDRLLGDGGRSTEATDDDLEEIAAMSAALVLDGKRQAGSASANGVAAHSGEDGNAWRLAGRRRGLR
jgi:acetyl/propionyl-CoA carboxylase alpha subunit